MKANSVVELQRIGTIDSDINVLIGVDSDNNVVSTMILDSAEVLKAFYDFFKQPAIRSKSKISYNGFKELILNADGGKISGDELVNYLKRKDLNVAICTTGKRRKKHRNLEIGDFRKIVLKLQSGDNLFVVLVADQFGNLLTGGAFHDIASAETAANMIFTIQNRKSTSDIGFEDFVETIMKCDGNIIEELLNQHKD